MRKHDFTYFFGEGVRNMFSHGFMSFAAVGITVACLVVMGTFSLVAYNAQVQLQKLESEYEILAFVDENCDEAQTAAVGRAIEQRENVKDCVFISKEAAIESFEEKYEGDELFQNLDPEILRDRYAVFVYDLNDAGETAQDLLDNVPGVAKVRVDEDIAGGFIALRNVAGVVCIRQNDGIKTARIRGGVRRERGKCKFFCPMLAAAEAVAVGCPRRQAGTRGRGTPARHGWGDRLRGSCRRTRVQSGIPPAQAAPRRPAHRPAGMPENMTAHPAR